MVKVVTLHMHYANTLTTLTIVYVVPLYSTVDLQCLQVC